MESLKNSKIIILKNNRKIRSGDANTMNTKKELISVNIEDIQKENKSESKIEINNNFEKNNKTLRNIIENAFFTQLSEIKVKLLDFENDPKKLPLIDLIELTLLNQNVSISKFKEFGYGLYVFFLYLINLLVTFGILLIFAFHYIYCIFFKYYRDYEDKYSLFFDYNILTLVSGVQIIRFRKYFIKTYGKIKFLEKYENFDVIYKEYFYAGTIVLIAIFLINFCFLLYLKRDYKAYKKDNPERKDFSLILSGKDVPYIKEKISLKDKNIDIKEKIKETEKEILDKLKKQNININGKLDIIFTLKLSDYYEKMENLISEYSEKDIISYKINKKKCCCFSCCCLCKIFYCCCKKKI